MSIDTNARDFPLSTDFAANPHPDSVVTGSLAGQMRERRSEMMVATLEDVALRLFEERGFGAVPVEEIASAARTSVRTFYRYFPAKEDVLQVRIDRRAEALRAALSARPADEAPMHALRLAFEEVISAEDTELLRRWAKIVAATPTLLRAVFGGILLKNNGVIADFFGSRLGVPSDALVPATMAAAAGAVIQAAQTRWFVEGGDFSHIVSESLAVLERGADGLEPASGDGSGTSV